MGNRILGTTVEHLARGVARVLRVTWRPTYWRPMLAPGARAQAKAAERDPIWTAVPPTAQEERRWTSLKDVDWYSWGSRFTTVGRYYRVPRPVDAALMSEWEAIAEAAGWTLVGRLCSPDVRTTAQITLTKRLGEWDALLVIGFGSVPDLLGLHITLPKAPLPDTGHRGHRHDGSPATTIASCFDLSEEPSR